MGKYFLTDVILGLGNSLGSGEKFTSSEKKYFNF